MLHNFSCFDLESRPNPEAVAKFTDAFPDFCEADVKCGNLKDAAKIAEKIAAAKATHESDRVAYWAKAVEQAALNPFTGAVVCIGVMDGESGSHTILHGDNEADTLAAFWRAFAHHSDATRKWVFWSGCGNSDENFDPDFIVTRSRILGVTVPTTVIQSTNRRFYSDRLVDLAKVFLLHRRNAYCSLTKAAELCGLYEATAGTDQALMRKADADPVQGKNFHQWWDGKASETMSHDEQRAQASYYLVNDMAHVRHLALRFL